MNDNASDCTQSWVYDSESDLVLTPVSSARSIYDSVGTEAPEQRESDDAHSSAHDSESNVSLASVSTARSMFNSMGTEGPQSGSAYAESSTHDSDTNNPTTPVSPIESMFNSMATETPEERQSMEVQAPEKQFEVDLNEVVCIVRDSEGRERDYVKLKHFAKQDCDDLTKLELLDFDKLKMYITKARLRKAHKPPHPDEDSIAMWIYYLHKEPDGKQSIRMIHQAHHWEVALSELLDRLADGSGAREIDFYVLHAGINPSIKTKG